MIENSKAVWQQVGHNQQCPHGLNDHRLTQGRCVSGLVCLSDNGNQSKYPILAIGGSPIAKWCQVWLRNHWYQKLAFKLFTCFPSSWAVQTRPVKRPAEAESRQSQKLVVSISILCCIEATRGSWPKSMCWNVLDSWRLKEDFDSRTMGGFSKPITFLRE